MCIEVFGYQNARTIEKIVSTLKGAGIEIRKHRQRKIHEQEERSCPVCSKTFKAIMGGAKKPQETCSRSCANTYFRSAANHPNWKQASYRSTCFLYHGKKCIICEENRLVEVHHLNENRADNNPENLVPLCPTHHQYWHSRYRSEVEPAIRAYISVFVNLRIKA